MSLSPELMKKSC